MIATGNVDELVVDASNGGSGLLVASANGTRIAFMRDVFGQPGACAETQPCRFQPFYLDVPTGRVEPLLPTSDGRFHDAPTGDVSFSADGRVAAITILTGSAFSHPSLPPLHPVVVLRYIDEGRTVLGARLPSGEPAICGGFQGIGSPRLSGDGRLLVFVTSCGNFPGNVVSGAPQAFMLDLLRNRLLMLSVDPAGNPGDYGAGIVPYYGPFPPVSSPILSLSPNISTDGRFVAFHSISTNLADGAPQYPDYIPRSFVRELFIDRGPSVPQAVPASGPFALALLISVLMFAVLWRVLSARRRLPS